MQLKPKLDKLKKRYRKSTKPQKTTTWILALLLLGLSAYGIAWLLDMKKFRDIESAESDITTAFVANLGAGVESQEQRKLCFKFAPGPFDDGYLWCQVATAIHLNREYSYEEMGKSFKSAASKIGDVSTEQGLSPSLKVSIGHGVDCILSYQLGKESYGNAMRIVIGRRESNIASVTCAASAMRAHYIMSDEYELGRY